MTVSFAHTHTAIIIISVFAADGSVCAILRVQSASATVAARRAHERRTLAGRLETQIIHTLGNMCSEHKPPLRLSPPLIMQISLRKAAESPERGCGCAVLQLWRGHLSRGSADRYACFLFD